MRKRKASGWDVHAPGYEAYSAMQAKQTGMSCVVDIAPALSNIFDRSVQPPWCQQDPDPTYPLHSWTATADACPNVRYGHRK